MDKGIIWSIARLFLFARNFSLAGFWFVSIFGFLFYRLYHIGCFALWGQTPEKMAARTKVVKKDGSAVGWGNAFLPNSVESLLTTLVQVLELKAATRVTSARFAATEFAKRSGLIDFFVPDTAVYIAWATQALVFSEFVVLFLNRKKRVIPDFLAGTVVIHDPRLLLFPWREKRLKRGERA